MVFALFGGDERSLRLARALEIGGHTVRTYALDAIGDKSSPEKAAEGADCVILPLPCESGGRLNAPFCTEPKPVRELLAAVAPGTPVCAGKVSPALEAECGGLGLPVYDYFAREDFTLKNAELTAEGVLGLLLSSPRALNGGRVLVCGFGRIGRLLAGKLRALGADVTVAARSPARRAEAEIMGCRAVSTENIAGDYDEAVNTIPATVFGTAALESIPGARLIELASPPYGFDRGAAGELGREIILASGLPGKTAPESAARAIMETILDILEERK